MLVEGYLNDGPLQTEAAVATVQIAKRLSQNNGARAKLALKHLIATLKPGPIREQAQEVINEMEKYEGYILTWEGAGPYSEKGKEGSVIFDTVFAPEKNAKDVKWKRIRRGVGSWDINLEAEFGARDHVAAYLRTQVWSPVETEARLEMGSDDGLKVWVNGKMVHANNTNRGLTPRQDMVKVKFQKGWNELLVKVVDHEGGWSFCCRVRKADGSGFDQLKVEVRR